MKNNTPAPKKHILQGPTVIKIQEEDIPYVFFTSDLHWNHKNILSFTQRGNNWTEVSDMNTGILGNYCLQFENDKIQEARENGHKIRFIHCGDLIFGSKSQVPQNLIEIQSEIDPLVDEVYAVFGNHDIQNILPSYDIIPSYSFVNHEIECNTKWFWNTLYIMEIYRGTKCICRFTISHFPMDDFYGAFNIHGHLHSQPDFNDNMNNKDIIVKYRNTGRHFDCGVDNNYYKAVSLADILEGKTSIVLSNETTGKRQFNY